MELILSTTFGLNLLLIFFTIRGLRNNFVNIFLLTLLSIVLIGTSFVISLNHITLSVPFLKHFINSLPALVGSLTYLYVFYSINSLKKFRLRSLLHFLPLVFAIPLSYNDMGGISIISVFLNIGLKILVSIIYFIVSLKLLKTYKNIIEKHFSKTENIDLKWLSFVVRVGLVAYTVYFFIMLMWALEIYLLANIEIYANVVPVLFIFSISYYSLSATKVFERISTFNSEIELRTEPKNDKKELLPPDEVNQILQKIIEIIETKKLFKNENLMLEDLANELKLHSKYVSYVINTGAGMNFFDFINRFRVREFNTQVLNPKHKNLTFLTIAFNCGFGSKSAFNRAYKSETGISPSEFIKKSRISEE